jgi:hypothetical protein
VTDPVVAALHRPVEHGLAEVEQGHIQVRQALQELQSEVAGPAAHVQHRAGAWCGGGGGERHQFEGQGGIDLGGLSGFQVGEAFDVLVEALPNFFRGGFHKRRMTHSTSGRCCAITLQW